MCHNNNREHHSTIRIKKKKVIIFENIFTSWLQISQKANDFLRVSAQASEMGQIKKMKVEYFGNY